ncbi:thioesterase II family protein [Phormidesmis sp. 146-35]
MRADFELLETYVYQPDSPFDCPIAAFGGRDDPKVDPTHLEAWNLHTTASFSLQLLPGDHFFLQSERSRLLQQIIQQLHPNL